MDITLPSITVPSAMITVVEDVRRLAAGDEAHRIGRTLERIRDYARERDPMRRNALIEIYLPVVTFRPSMAPSGCRVKVALYQLRLKVSSLSRFMSMSGCRLWRAFSCPSSTINS